MTTQNKLIFFAIIGVAILIIGGLFLLEQTNVYTLPSRRTLQATIQVAAPTSLEKWLQAAAKTFNQQDPNFQVQIIAFKSNEASRKLTPSNPNLPDVWLPEADFMHLDSIPYQPQGLSIAQDKLIWVGIQGKVQENDLNWQPIHDLALNEAQFNLALPPVRTASRMATCVSATASYHQTATLTANQGSASELRRWFNEILDTVPNRERNPQEQLARRPPQVWAGLLLRSEAYTLTKTNFISHDLEYNVLLNYPYLIRTDWPELATQDAAAHQMVAEKFRDFLLSNPQQQLLVSYGFEAAQTTPTGQFVPSDEAIMRSLQWCWQ